MMINSHAAVPKPQNEPPLSYAPGTPERALLKQELERQKSECITIPLLIDGQPVYTEKRLKVVMPHDHGHVLAECCLAGEAELKLAIERAMAAKQSWEELPWEHRASVFLRAAELIRGKYRYQLNAATMLGQGKVAYQAETDAPCEITDFLRFNVYYADSIFRNQPENKPAVWRSSFTPYKPQKSRMDGLSGKNFSGGSVFSDNKAFRKLRFARCLKKWQPFFGFNV